VVDDMPVPKVVDTMRKAVYPVAGKVEPDKSQCIHQPGGFDFKQPDFSCEPVVGHHHNGEPKHIFDYIGQAGTQAG